MYNKYNATELENSFSYRIVSRLEIKDNSVSNILSIIKISLTLSLSETKFNYYKSLKKSLY